MRTLIQMPRDVMSDRGWRAALVLLCEQFSRDAEVWMFVDVGERIRWRELLELPHLTPHDRVMLAYAAGLVHPEDSPRIEVSDLVTLPDRQLRSVLDSTAIFRARCLPIWDDEPVRPVRRVG
ncbi:hypothetical protein ABN028_19950 [Actinopolymorpha sp. B17G11]|uniref:hypothetical protein n=1 Tax=Actinopolymorpha sp. B17G11 TaxID=3160861 RepID=UPI0032E48C09